MKKIKIAKTHPMYLPVIEYIKKKNLDIECIKRIKISTNRKLNVKMANEELYVFQDFPDSLLKQIIEIRNQKNLCNGENAKKNKLTEILKLEKENIDELMKQYFTVSGQIYFKSVFRSENFSIVLYMNGHCFNKDFGYETLLNERNILLNDKLDYQEFLTAIIDLILTFDKVIKTKGFQESLIQTNISKFEQYIENVLKKTFSNIEVKERKIKILLNNKHIETKLELKNFFSFNEKNFEFKNFQGLDIPIGIKIEDKKLDSIAQKIKEKLLKENIQIKAGDNTLFHKYKNKLKERIVPLYTGLQKTILNDFTTEIIVLNSELCLKTENEYLVAIQKNNNLKVEYKKEKNKLEFILSASYQDCKKYIEDKLKSKKYKLEQVSYKSGEGLLFGKTEINISKNGRTFTIKFNVKSVLNGKNNWKSLMGTAIKNIDSSIEAILKKENEEYRQKYPLLYGSILLRDILELSKNGMTKSEIIHILRGTKLSKFKKSGSYKMLSEKYLSDFIENLISLKYLTKKNDLIKTGSNKPYSVSVNDNDVKKAIQKEFFLCYYEIAYLFEKNHKSDSENFALFNAIENLEFLCFYKEKYITYMKNKPKFKQLFKMKYENGFYDKKENIIIETIKKIIS